MQTIATEDILEELDFAPEDEAEEIAQNVAALMVTAKGTVPLERGMGLSMRHKDQPPSIAKMMLESELADVVGEYEERAEVTITKAETDETGDMKATAEVTFYGG